VLAALTVFAVVAAGAATATISTTRGNAASRYATAAAALIHDKMEQLRALDPALNPADLTTGAHNDPLNPISDVGAAGGIYTRSWTVTRNSPRKGIADVRVTVSWNAPATRTLTSATYVCLTPTCK
jgi:type II secretory pathway pseudopilin PulG